MNVPPQATIACHIMCSENNCRQGFHPAWCGTIRAKDLYINSCERQIYLAVMEIKEMSALLRKFGFIRKNSYRNNYQESSLWARPIDFERGSPDTIQK